MEVQINCQYENYKPHTILKLYRPTRKGEKPENYKGKRK